MIMDLKVVILSGGVGSRLWPLSRKSRPKQYLNIFGEKSLFGLALERNRNISNNFIVVGNGDNNHLSRAEMQKANKNYIEIIEALPRNTAAAIAFAAFASSPEDILLVIPSDHMIENVDAYEHSVEEAVKLAAQDALVTFGIKPIKPETGYGYIEANGNDVISFREKPNRDTAVSFVNSGRFFWNSGMFCFKARVFLEELERYEPKIYSSGKKAWDNANNGKLGEEQMLNIPSKSIDYAVMERSTKIKMVAGDFGWSDLGSFESLYDYYSRNGKQPDENGNMYIGGEKTVHFLGLRNSIIVETPDALLLLNKDNAQDVKNIFEKLEIENPNLIK